MSNLLRVSSKTVTLSRRFADLHEGEISKLQISISDSGISHQLAKYVNEKRLAIGNLPEGTKFQGPGYTMLKAFYFLDHFEENSDPVITEAEDQDPDDLSILQEGISGSLIAMHHRDYCAAADAVAKFLQPDLLAERLGPEYESLPADIREEMDRKRNYGIYGLFNQVSKPEVPVALYVIGRTQFPNFKLNEYFATQLRDSEIVRAMIERFPVITPEKIAAALNA